MGWQKEMPPEQRAAFGVWLDTVLHDLVKYLELMPRNIDWDAVEEDDLETLYEAIFETRVDRRGARSAQVLWSEALAALPHGVELPIKGAVEHHLTALEAARAALESEDMGAVDVAGLRASIFGIGDLLRGLRG